MFTVCKVPLPSEKYRDVLFRVDFEIDKDKYG